MASAQPVILIVDNASEPLLHPSDFQKDWTRRFATSAYAWLSHVATCVLLGFLSAVALKLFGPPIASATLLLFILVLVLAYYGYVNLNWGTVTHAFLGRLDVDQDRRVNFNDFKVICGRVYRFVISFGLSSVGGYLVGVWMGFKLL